MREEAEMREDPWAQMRDPWAQMREDPWHVAARELAAVTVERLALEAVAMLRGSPCPDRGPAIERPAEEGDEISGELTRTAVEAGVITPRLGITEQAGWTEAEWEDAYRRR